MADDKPLVLITGAAGNIGRSLAERLRRDYRIVGMDRGDAVEASETQFPIYDVDLTDDGSVAAGLARVRAEHGDRIASVIHLVAYFDFTGEEKPQYRAVNVEGTRRLLTQLQDFEVEQFLYSGTMLVHAPTEPGEAIDESQPIGPGWAYPKSKAETEEAIREAHGRIPYVILRLAGVYDDRTSVPTFANQIARIYERDFQAHLYSGDTDAGQAMLHRDDMLDAFVRAVDKRAELADGEEILIGEPEAIGYDDLQDRLGQLIHGDAQWRTIRLPATVAAVGAWAQDKAEPIIPDAFDQGERPFIKPFMTKMASDHYALDISKAERLLGWRPRRRLHDELPAVVERLKADPIAWYGMNKITPPDWMTAAAEHGHDPEDLRAGYEARYRREHAASRWAHFVNIGLGLWILTQPVIVQVEEPGLFWSEVVLGSALMLFASLSLSWRLAWARWAQAGVAALIMAVPFVFWTENPAAFLSDTLVGSFAFGLAIGTKPEVGPTPLAAQTGPDIPPGWSYNPSTWTQRVPIIALALVGLLISRYLTAYQLGQVDHVWEPFFPGLPDRPQLNGTETIITSKVSEDFSALFRIPDAALGGYTYALEILTGIVGTRARWRTMPWLVFLFGLMIAPLGVTSIFFVIIQPITIGTWATLTLIGAAAMLIQVPYSLDELLATLQFLKRRVQAGRPFLSVFLFGDTDEGETPKRDDEFDRPAATIARDMVGGGVNLPWTLWLAGALGLSLLFTRLTFGAEGGMANSDHLIGFLIMTIVSLAAGEVARALRFLIIPLGAALFVTPFWYGATTAHTVTNIAIGAAVIALSFKRGAIKERYGSWQKMIV